MPNIKIEDGFLVIREPLQVKGIDSYSDDEFIRDNIIGIIEPKGWETECGFAYRIDMSYKGKADQWTECFYKYFGDVKSFKKLCKKLGIEYYEYEQCCVCKKAIYGCFTFKGGKPVHEDCLTTTTTRAGTS